MLSETDKRMQSLKVQLYGKGQSHKVRLPLRENVQNPFVPTSTYHLKQDLTKIAFLASLATASQIILYISLQLGYIKF